MSMPSESQVEEQLQLKRARELAAVRDTAGIRKVINVLFVICLLGSVIPGIGIIAVLAGLLVGAFGSVYLIVRGNGRGGLVQLLVTGVGTLVATVAWAVVTFLVFAQA